MTSKVSICNQALGWLGANLITSFEDGITESNLCEVNYDPLRRVVLEECPWSFAVGRTQLNEITDGPVYGYDHAYQLPTDLIRVLNVNDGSREIIEWTKEGDKILCDSGTVYIKYIKDEFNVAAFSPGFTQSLAARIAMDLALVLTHSKAMAESMTALYGEKLSLAETLDGMQGVNEKFVSNQYKVSR